MILPNKSGQSTRLLQLLSISGRSEKCSSNKTYFTSKVIQDNNQRVDPVVQGSFLDLGDPCRRKAGLKSQVPLAYS